MPGTHVHTTVAKIYQEGRKERKKEGRKEEQTSKKAVEKEAKN